MDKDLLFTMSNNPTRGHPLKIFKKRYCLPVTGHFFSNRVVGGWNDLPPEVVSAPSLNSFKSRLNKCWKGHSYNLNSNHGDTPWVKKPDGEITRMHLQRSSGLE